MHDLPAFCDESIRTLVEGDPIPITPHRALSHSKNPHASADDIGLLVAYSEGRCIGFVGMVPGVFRAHGEEAKIHWITAVFVTRRFRGAGVAALLMQKAMSLNYDLIMA